ncbi:MAG TPA: hypothetical protein VFW22_06845 [Pseudolabrys sp.]|nr:hypothetical protein [Pseudolabrys sp.]
MQWRWGRRAGRVAWGSSWFGAALSALCALTLAACNLDEHPTAVNGQPRGATVAFESIDGMPPGQFKDLVQALNAEAQTRRLAVMSRESPSAYRVRGYLSASVAKRQTTISWVWDVFDGDGHRALRIAGAETTKERHRSAWSAADDAMLRRIASNSMDQLAAFLTSPEVAPGTPDAEARMALATAQDSSPEAAGIFRIAHADPLPAGQAPEAPAVSGRDAPAKLAASR